MEGRRGNEVCSEDGMWSEEKREDCRVACRVSFETPLAGSDAVASKSFV
jgi:hypothetical protein